MQLIELTEPGKKRKIYKRYRIADVIKDAGLSGFGLKIEVGRSIVLDGRIGRITKVNSEFFNVCFHRPWDYPKGLGVLKTFMGHNWILRPEIAPSGRARCRICKREIPKGSVRYDYGQKARSWPWENQTWCLPCTYLELEGDYRDLQQQINSMRRRMGPYKKRYKELKALNKKLGVDTKKTRLGYGPEHQRSKGDKILE